MVLETKIEAKVVAGVDKGSFNKVEQQARDTGKKINQDLKVKMEVDIAKAQLKLKELRAQLRSKDLTKAQRLQIQVDTNRAQRNVTELKRKLNNLVNTGNAGVSRLQAKFNSLGKGIASSFKSMFGAAAAVGLLMGAVRGLFSEFNAAAKASRDFEKSMSNISTLIDTDVESMDKMNKAVLEIAKDSPKSIAELTSALYDIRSAGIPAADAMDVLDKSAKLATAGLGSVQEATNLMTSAFNAFSSQGYTAEQIASTLFLTVKNGKTTISELAQGFGGLAGLSATLGVDFRELMAATSALTTTGQSASEAYSGLKGIMTAVAKQTPKSVKAAKELGIEFSATALASKGLKGFLEDINTKLKDQGIEGPKATEALAGMFGRVEALNAVLALTNANQEAFNISMQDMTTNTTAFMEAYDKQSATVEARVARLTNELEVQRIELGDTTSSWQGFGIYLKIQFLDILNKIGKTIGIIADIFVGSWKIIYQSAKGALTGIKDGIVNLFKTGKFEFNFDFGSAAKEAKSLASKLTSAFDGSSKDTAVAVKQRNDIVKQYNDELKKDNESVAESTKKTVASTKDYEKAVKDMSGIAGKAYDDLTKKIKASQNAQKALKDELNGIDKDIATRINEINKALEDPNTSATDKQKLKAEKASAYTGLSDEEQQKLKDQVKEIADYEKLTQIEKLQALKIEKETALAEEVAKEQELLTQKEDLQNSYSEFLKGKVVDEMDLAEKLRQKWLAVAAARAKAGGGGTSGVGARAAGGPITAGSPYIVGERGPELIVPQNNGQVIPNHNLTINQNVNANVANGVDMDQLANQLARKITLAGKGIR